MTANTELEEDGITDNTEITIEGKKNSKLFGIFKTKRNVEYKVDKDGNVREKGWMRFFYADVE